MVKQGHRILEGVEVQISKIEQILTPSPTVSDKDASDLAQKIRYLIDQAEAILAQLNVKLDTRASESTLSSLNAKIQTQSPDLFVKDLSVGTDAVQVDTDSAYRDEVIILADSGNTDTVYVGNSSSQLFPLAAGASTAIKKTALNLIYLRAASGTQSVHVISGGA